VTDEGWFYYEGDGRSAPTLEQQAVARRLQFETFGAELANVSVTLCEKRPSVHIGFGGDLPREEITPKIREWVQAAIEALTDYLAEMDRESPGQKP
jgi:hypothetical protein